MSKVYFRYLAPIFIVAAIEFVIIKPELNQQLAVDFVVVYYGVVWLSRLFIGQPSSVKPAYPTTKLCTDQFKGLYEVTLREYEYIRETMAQAMNDRHTMINFFLLATGVVIAAIGAIYSQEGMSDSPYKQEITIAICLTFAFVGWIYLLKMVRLRQAWCESSVAMSRIKNFFMLNAGINDEHGGSPFLWKSSTRPKPAKIGSLFHLEIILIGFLSAIAVAMVSVMLLPKDFWKTHWGIPGAFFLYHLLLQVSCYGVFLEEQKVDGKTRKTESRDQKNAVLNQPNSAPPQAGSEDCKPKSRRVILQRQETVFDKFFKIQQATLQFEKFDGTLSSEVKLLNFERGASVALLLHDAAKDELILVEQFRYPVYAHDATDGWLLEIIAGMVDEGESPEAAVKREAIEETGYEASEIELLSEFYASPGGSSERISVFFGRMGKKVSEGGGKPQEKEDIRIVRLPVARAYQFLDQRLFEDAKTIVALLAARSRLMNTTSAAP